MNKLYCPKCKRATLHYYEHGKIHATWEREMYMVDGEIELEDDELQDSLDIIECKEDGRRCCIWCDNCIAEIWVEGDSDLNIDEIGITTTGPMTESVDMFEDQ